MTRRVGVVSVARSDYGVYRPLLKRLAEAPDVDLALIVAGMHLMPEFGASLEEIEADGFTPAAKVDLDLRDDTPLAVARAMGTGTGRFADADQRLGLDLLFVLGDRFEMHAAAVAAVPFLLPLAHIAGGSLTRGAIDDSLRHSITKLSCLHFVETETHAARVRQMGEEAWRVHLTGALNLDNIAELPVLPPAELNHRFGIDLDLAAPPLLVTFHPVTRDFAATRRHAEELLAALAAAGHPIVFTYPNADTGGRAVIDLIDAFVREHPRARAVPNLGVAGYFNLMRHARAMVGNSSSGLIEAASFRLPVVNVGERQDGRLAPANVIHVPCTKDAILNGIRRATSTAFRESIARLISPYGDGHAAERVLAVLRATDLTDPRLIRKDFIAIAESMGCGVREPA